jgi:hypothetical protein
VPQRQCAVGLRRYQPPRTRAVRLCAKWSRFCCGRSARRVLKWISSARHCPTYQRPPPPPPSVERHCARTLLAWTQWFERSPEGNTELPPRFSIGHTLPENEYLESKRPSTAKVSPADFSAERPPMLDGGASVRASEGVRAGGIDHDLLGTLDVHRLREHPDCHPNWSNWSARPMPVGLAHGTADEGLRSLRGGCCR